MATERLAPDAVLDSLNYTTLNLADIDEDPDSPDASYGTWDGNGNTSARVSFPTPSGPPTVGAGLQEFRALIRRTGAASLGWSLQLWENGAQVSVLATGTLATTSTVVSGTWNASSLGTANGSLVECRLEQTSGGTGGGRQGIEIGAVEWNVTYSIVTTRNVFAQAQASIKQTYNAFAQAQAKIVSDATLTDTWTRTETDTWGTSDSGQTWDNASTLTDVNGTEGIIELNSTNSNHNVMLGEGTIHFANTRALYRFKTNRVAVGESIFVQHYLRREDGDNYYRFEISMRTNQKFRLTIASAVATPTGTDIAGPTADLTGIADHAVDTWYWVKSEVIGSLLRWKIWRDGDTEPYWQQQVVNTDQSTGTFGYRVSRGTGYSGTYPILYSFDDLTVENNVTLVNEGFGQAMAEIAGSGGGGPGTITFLADLGTTVNDTAGTSGTHTLSTGVAAGNFVAVQIVVSATGNTVNSVQDNKGNTYNVDVHRNATVPTTAIASSVLTNALVASDVITVNFASSGVSVISVSSYSGVKLTSPLDKTASDGNTGTTLSSGLTATTTDAVELLIGTIGNVGSLTRDWTPTGTGTWNELTENNSTSVLRSLHPQYQIVSSTGTYELAGTLSTSADWNALIATYKAEPTAGGAARGYGQAQASIKQTYNQFAQGQADIKQTYNVQAQSQAQIKQTYRSHAQAQANIKQTYRSHAQAQAWIETTYNQHAQAQGSIKQIYSAFAQTQAQLKQTYSAYAQAQALIAKTAYVHAQTQAQIKQTYVAHGQSQARIMVLVGYDNFNRTVADGWGDATYNFKWINFRTEEIPGIWGNGSVDGEAGLADVDADLEKHGDSTFAASYGGYPLLKQGMVQYDFWVPANTETSADYNMDLWVTAVQVVKIAGSWSIKTVFGSTYTLPLTLDPSSWYTVKFTVSDISETIYAKVWKRGTQEPDWMVSGLQTNLTRSPNYFYIEGLNAENAKIDNIYFWRFDSGLFHVRSGLARAFIAKSAGYGQAQADIKQTYSALAQAQAHIVVTGINAFAQAQAEIQINLATRNAFGQAQGQIKQTYNSFAQTQATVLATYQSHAQAQGAIVNTYVAHGQAAAWIEATYTAHGQSQASVKQSYVQFAQSQASVLQVYVAHGQANAYIILVDQNAFGQTQSQIKQSYLSYGQAQANIKQTSFGLAQAQADIKQTYSEVGQAQALLKNTYFGLGQAQATVRGTAFGQAQAYIYEVNDAYGQSQASIKAVVSAFGQAQAQIAVAGTENAQAQALIYIPQFLRPDADITVDGWVRVVI